LCGVPGRPLSRFLLGGVAGGAIGAIVWFFGISNPGLGTRILLECVAAGLVISASVEGERAAPRAGGSGRSLDEEAFMIGRVKDGAEVKGKLLV
jgi:hypothetical protein